MLSACQSIGVGPKVFPPIFNQANATSNETVPSGNETVPSGNETVPSGSETAPTGNETIPSSNETVPSNETMPADEIMPIIPAENESAPSNETSSENETLEASQSYNKIGAFWNPILDTIIDRALTFDVLATTSVNETIRSNLNISSVDTLSASLVASYVNGIVNSVYPFNVWQITVLPSNLTEGTDWYSSCIDCYRMMSDPNYIVIAAWLPTNSMGALSISDFANMNTAGSLQEVGLAMATVNNCTMGVNIIASGSDFAF